MAEFNPQNIAEHIYKLTQTRDNSNVESNKAEAIAYTKFLISVRVRAVSSQETKRDMDENLGKPPHKEIADIQKLLAKLEQKARNLSSDVSLQINIKHALSDIYNLDVSGTDRLLANLENMQSLVDIQNSPKSGRKENIDAAKVIESVIQIYERAIGLSIADLAIHKTTYKKRQYMTKLYELADLQMVKLDFYQSQEAIRKQITRYIGDRDKYSDINQDIAEEIQEYCS